MDGLQGKSQRDLAMEVSEKFMGLKQGNGSVQRISSQEFNPIKLNHGQQQKCKEFSDEGHFDQQIFGHSYHSSSRIPNIMMHAAGM